MGGGLDNGELASVAVSKGKWSIAELLLGVEIAEILEILEWYRNR